MLHSRLDIIARSLPHEVDPAMKIAANAISEGAKERVPVESGDLRNAIHVEDIEDGYRVVGGSGDVFYGHFVEHGTVKLPARPFMAPAAEAVRNNIDSLVRAALRDL